MHAVPETSIHPNCIPIAIIYNMDPGPTPAQLQVMILNSERIDTIHVVQTHVSVKQAVEHLYSHASFSKKIHLLQGLTQVEEMLISVVLPIMSLYRLPHGEDSDFTSSSATDSY